MGQVAGEICRQIHENGQFKREIVPLLNSCSDNYNVDFWKQTILYLNDHDGLDWWQNPHWLTTN